MAFDDHSNLAYSNVANAPGTAGTSLVVTTGQGARFPTPPFNATVWPSGALPLNTGVAGTTAEIVRVTSVTGDTFTISRSSESIGSGSTAANIASGHQFAATITEKAINDLEAAINLLSTFTSVSSNTTLTSLNHFVKASASGGSFTVILPDATTLPAGWHCYVKKTDGSVNVVTVATSSGQTVDGSPAEMIREPGRAAMFVTDGSNWSLY
jgi:hypothetical protein